MSGDEIADHGGEFGAAVFLASEASAWMTGQTLFVDGGFSSGTRWPIDEAT